MAKKHILPDGNFVLVPDNMSFAEADDWARHAAPESFGIDQKHGFIEATKAGAKQGIGSALTGIGSLTGSSRLSDAGEAMLKPSEEPGAYRETTGEDVDAAYKKGIFSGLKASYDKTIGEPFGGMVGRYAIPTAASMGAGAAALSLAPEGALGLGAAGLSELAGGTAFTAANAPSALGEDLAYNKQVDAKDIAEGRTPQEHSKAESVATALVQSAIMPVFGHLARSGMKLMGLMGPEIAQTTKAVMTGDLPYEAAVKKLNSNAKNYLVSSGENAAAAIPMMTGNTALERMQAGQDMTGDDASDAYLEDIKGATPFALAMGLGGLRTRGKQMKALNAAGADWKNTANIASDFDTREQAAQKLKDYQDAQAQFRSQQAQDPNQGPTQQSEMPAMQGDLGLQGKYTATGKAITQDKIGPTPDKLGALPPHIQQMQQELRDMQISPADPLDPNGAKAKAEAIAAKQAELNNEIRMLHYAAPETPVTPPKKITRKFLESDLGLDKTKNTPGRALADQFVGQDLNDPAVAAALNEALMAHGQTLSDEGKKPKTQAKIEAFVNDSTDKLQAQKLNDSSQWQQGDMLPSLDEHNTEQAVKAQQAKDAAQAAAWQAQQDKMNAARAAKALAKPPTKEGGVRDMFSGRETVPDMSEKPLPDPNDENLTAKERADAFDQHNDRMYKMFLEAHDEYLRTGDDTMLKAVLADAKNGQMGQFQAATDAASTRAMFDKNGRPTQGAKQNASTPRPVEPVQPNPNPVNPAGGGGDGMPVSGSGGVRVHNPVEPVGATVEPSTPVDAVPPVAEGNGKPAVTPPLTPEAVKNTAQQLHDAAITKRAASLWDAEANKDGSILENFKDLHPDAQAMVKAAAKKMFKGDEFEPQLINRVLQEHVDAVARGNAKNRPAPMTPEELQKAQDKYLHENNANRIEASSLSTNIHQPMEHKEMMHAINNGKLKDVLDAIARNAKLSEPLRELARAMQNMTSLDKVKIGFKEIPNKPDKFTGGRYDNVNDEIQINQELLNHEQTRPTDEIVAHEVMHALTRRKTRQFEEADLAAAQRRAAGLPTDLEYQKLRATPEYKSFKKLGRMLDELNNSSAGFMFKYALKNVDELMVEAFSNSEFQKLLATIKYTDSAVPKISNMWQGFVSALKGILGYKGTDNALHGVLSHAATIADSYKGEALKSAAKDAPSPLELPRAKPFSKSVPKDATVMLEHEGGVEQEHNARGAMRDAEKHLKIMEALKECIGA